MPASKKTVVPGLMTSVAPDGTTRFDVTWYGPEPGFQVVVPAGSVKSWIPQAARSVRPFSSLSSRGSRLVFFPGFLPKMVAFLQL